MTKEEKNRRLKMIFNTDRQIFQDLIMVASIEAKQQLRKDKLDRLKKLLTEND